MIKWMNGLLSAGTMESSKRFCMVISYIAAVVYAGACIFFGFPLENNVLTLILGALGGSTTGYVFSNKNEVKQIKAIEDDKQS